MLRLGVGVLVGGLLGGLLRVKVRVEVRDEGVWVSYWYGLG